MVIASERSFKATLTFGAAGLFLGALEWASPSGALSWGGVAVGVLFLALVCHAERVRDSRSIDIDIEHGRIIERQRTWLLGWKVRTFPLSRFTSVRSYVTPFRNACDRVELVTDAGGEALLIAECRPAPVAATFFAKTSPRESPAAAELRTRLASHLKLTDRGFLGERWPGAEVSPEKERTREVKRR